MALTWTWRPSVSVKWLPYEYVLLPGTYKIIRTILLVDCVWNVMEHAQKTDFVFQRNGQVHLNWRGCRFSQLLAAEVRASAVVMMYTPFSEVVWRVLATHSIRQFPLHFLPCVTVCHHVSAGLYQNCIRACGLSVAVLVRNVTGTYITPWHTSLNLPTGSCPCARHGHIRSSWWTKGSASRPGRFIPAVNKTLGEPSTTYGRFGEETTLSSIPGIETRFSNSVV